MAKRASKLERFTSECMSASPEELDAMFDVLRAVRGKRGPQKPKAQATRAKPKFNALDRQPVEASDVLS